MSGSVRLRSTASQRTLDSRSTRALRRAPDRLRGGSDAPSGARRDVAGGGLNPPQAIGAPGAGVVLTGGARPYYLQAGDAMVRREETQKIQLLDVERRLERVERLLRAAADEARGARIDLGHKSGPGERWARMMFAVLDEVDRLGGEVSRRRFLQIGEKHGYNHRGMAGFYHQLVEPIPDYKTRLTAGGRERLRTLRERYGEGADPS